MPNSNNGHVPTMTAHDLRAANLSAAAGFHERFMRDVDRMIEQCSHDHELMKGVEHLLELLHFAVECQLDRVRRLNKS